MSEEAQLGRTDDAVSLNGVIDTYTEGPLLEWERRVREEIVAGDAANLAEWLQRDIVAHDTGGFRRLILQTERETDRPDKPDVWRAGPTTWVEPGSVWAIPLEDRDVLVVAGKMVWTSDGRLQEGDAEMRLLILQFFQEDEEMVRIRGWSERPGIDSYERYVDEIIGRIRRFAQEVSGSNESADAMARGSRRSRGGTSRIEERPDWPDKVAKARHYHRLRAGNTIKEGAATQAGFASIEAADLVIKRMVELGIPMNEETGKSGGNRQKRV